ncbi:MAG TPA: ComF family protein [Gammaproteobacteria bacterium]|nr:ComF family protein [Gammaproteobacteria bacterium]
MHKPTTYLSKSLTYLGFCPCCTLCQQTLDHYQRICPDCLNHLPFIAAACGRCARPLPDPHLTCGQCQQHPPPWDRLWVPLDYMFPVDQLVLGGKFAQGLHNLSLLAELFIDYWRKQDVAKPHFLLPVPLHPKRLRERGYNQALELARIIGRELNIPIIDGSQRTTATLAQASLSAIKRRRNVQHAFTVQMEVEGAHLAIVDDVFTTGSTVAALSTVLRRAGAAQIDIYAMARSLGHTD